jgi:hypothetical protein
MNKEPGAKKEPLSPGHETSDLDARAVAWCGAGLAVMIAVIFFALRALFGYFNSRHPAGAAAGRNSAPPEPRLQVDPAGDLARFRERENAVINSYGWVDRTAGVVRIPIGRAMDIMALRGLPAPQPGPGKTRLEMRQERANAEKPPP